jgi:hypothetical protein
MQYFTSPEHSNFQKVSNAIDRYFNVIDFCFEIRALGGEPFLNPALDQYINMLLRYSSQYYWIIILTNVTIIPK